MRRHAHAQTHTQKHRSSTQRTTLHSMAINSIVGQSMLSNSHIKRLYKNWTQNQAYNTSSHMQPVQRSTVQGGDLESLVLSKLQGPGLSHLSNMVSA